MLHLWYFLQTPHEVIYKQKGVAPSSEASPCSSSHSTTHSFWWSIWKCTAAPGAEERVCLRLHLPQIGFIFANGSSHFTPVRQGGSANDTESSPDTVLYHLFWPLRVKECAGALTVRAKMMTVIQTQEGMKCRSSGIVFFPFDFFFFFPRPTCCWNHFHYYSEPSTSPGHYRHQLQSSLSLCSSWTILACGEIEKVLAWEITGERVQLTGERLARCLLSLRLSVEPFQVQGLNFRQRRSSLSGCDCVASLWMVG